MGRASAPLTAGLLSIACLIISNVALGADTGELQRRNLFGIVNGAEISRAEFEAFFARYARSKMYHGVPENRVAALRAEAGEALVIRHLLAQEAERRGIAGDADSVDARVRQYENRYRETPSWPTVRKNLPRLKTYLLETSRSEALTQVVRRVADPDEQTLKTYYRDNLKLFTEPPRTKVSAVILGVEPWREKAFWEKARAKAADLLAQLADGADFADLARKNSTHQSSKNGGDLGYLHTGALSDNVQAEIDKLALGETTPPVRVLEGYGLFRVVDRKAERVRAFDQVRERVTALYKRVRSEQKWNAFIGKLRAAADVAVDDSVVSGSKAVSGAER